MNVIARLEYELAYYDSAVHRSSSLNSKVIKSFVPELRSRKCFSCFGIPMCVMNILCTLHVFMYGYVTRTCERLQWSGTSHSPKLQHYRSLTIRLFSVISWTLVGWRWGFYSSANRQSVGLKIDWGNVSIIFLNWTLLSYRHDKRRYFLKFAFILWHINSCG